MQYHDSKLLHLAFFSPFSILSYFSLLFWINFARSLSRKLLPLGWMFLWQWKRILRQIRLLVGFLKCKFFFFEVSFSSFSLRMVFLLLYFLCFPCFFSLYFNCRYAYAVASALHDVGNILYKDFMIQVLREIFLFLYLFGWIIIRYAA